VIADYAVDALMDAIPWLRHVTVMIRSDSSDDGHVRKSMKWVNRSQRKGQRGAKKEEHRAIRRRRCRIDSY